MKKHVVMVVEGEHGAETTREVRLTLPENLAWDIERHVEGSTDAVYSVLLATSLRYRREGSTQVGALKINAHELLWKYGYVLTAQEKTVLDRWERGEIPALEAVERLLKDHHGNTLAIQSRQLSPDPLIPFPDGQLGLMPHKKPGEQEAEFFLRRLKGMEHEPEPLVDASLGSGENQDGNLQMLFWYSTGQRTRRETCEGLGVDDVTLTKLLRLAGFPPPRSSRASEDAQVEAALEFLGPDPDPKWKQMPDAEVREAFGEHSKLVFSAKMGVRLVLGAFASGVLGRTEAMELLGFQWYGELLDAMRENGIDRGDAVLDPKDKAALDRAMPFLEEALSHEQEEKKKQE